MKYKESSKPRIDKLYVSNKQKVTTEDVTNLHPSATLTIAENQGWCHIASRCCFRFFFACQPWPITGDQKLESL